MKNKRTFSIHPGQIPTKMKTLRFELFRRGAKAIRSLFRRLICGSDGYQQKNRIIVTASLFERISRPVYIGKDGRCRKPPVRMKNNTCRRLKRYVIHILAAPAMNADAFDLPMERNALISCTDRTNAFLSGDSLIHKLIIPFPDVEDRRVAGAFNGAHARAIIRFLQSLPDEVTDLYVVCSKGGSRSPALAAAILKASGRSDDAVWKNPFYVPNTLVYERMRRELGFITPHFVVKYKKRLNEKAFKKAQRRGDAGEFERWKIIK